MLSWILASMRCSPQNRKSRRRGLRPPRAERVAPTPDPDESPCKQMHGREIWFRCARVQTIRSSASGIMMPKVGPWTHKSGGGCGLEGLIQAQTSRCTESSAGLARSFLRQSFQLSFNCICRVSDVPHRFRKPFLRYIEFVGPILNFMGLKKADSASILRTPVGEIIWHTFSPLEATRWGVGQFPVPHSGEVGRQSSGHRN